MGNSASKPSAPASEETSGFFGRLWNGTKEGVSVLTAPIRYGIWFWGRAYDLVRLIIGGAPFEEWPMEVKWLFFLLCAVAFGFLYLGLSPFLSVPEWILGWILYLQEELLLDIWELLKWVYFSLTEYFGISDTLAAFTAGSGLTFLLLTLLEKVLSWALFDHAGDDEYVRTYDFLCYPITLLLHHLDPAFFTKRDSSFPYLSYAYDWFCAILIFPWQTLAALITPFVHAFWVPDNTWVLGKHPFLDRIGDKIADL